MLGLVVALNAYHSRAVLNWAPVTFHPFIPRVGTLARHWLEVVSRVSLDTRGRRGRFRLGGSWDARMPYAGSMHTHMARVWVFLSGVYKSIRIAELTRCKQPDRDQHRS